MLRPDDSMHAQGLYQASEAAYVSPHLATAVVVSASARASSQARGLPTAAHSTDAPTRPQRFGSPDPPDRTVVGLDCSHSALAVAQAQPVVDRRPLPHRAPRSP